MENDIKTIVNIKKIYRRAIQTTVIEFLYYDKIHNN